jgi:alpha-tubulin suppressor-like RCC1 family protein
VFCWGYNWAGQIGDGTEEARFVPVRVPGLSGVVQISSRSHTTCALLLDGALKCWGFNLYGQIGDGTTSNRHSPVDVVGTGSQVIAISVSEMHACALMQGGGVKCWGNNLRGQLGDGSFTQRLTPVNVQSLAGAVSVSTGDAHGCAVTSTGAIKCWGYASYGQLGTGAGGGTTPDQPLPVDVLGLSSGVASVSCGFRSTCALTADGRALCWGDAGIDTPSNFADHDSGERYGPVAVPTWPRQLEWIFQNGFDP